MPCSYGGNDDAGTKALLSPCYSLRLERGIALRLPVQEICFVPQHQLSRRMHSGRHFSLEAGCDMAEPSEVWNLHLVYQLSHIPPGFDDDVHRRVRAIEGVTRVAVVPSDDAATHLAFSTRYAHAAVVADEAKQCLQEAIVANNANLWCLQLKVRHVDEYAVGHA